MEYIALSRDTTETDLKQRREIRAGTAFYIDQASSYPAAVTPVLWEIDFGSGKRGLMCPRHTDVVYPFQTDLM